MRNHVTFHYPTEYVGDDGDGGGILDVSGATWFAELLRRIPGLEVDEDLCQEDWGVVVDARRNRRKFSIGLSGWSGNHMWLAHFHHATFAWLQAMSASGKDELARLIADAHRMLTIEPLVSDVTWYEQRELDKPQPKGLSTPVEG